MKSRYWKFFKKAPVEKPRPRPFAQMQLDGTAEWFSSIFHQQQILTLGKKSGQLFLARFDCVDCVEYFGLCPFEEGMTWGYAPENTVNLLVYMPSSSELPPFPLPETLNFPQEITIHFMGWLPKTTWGFALCEEETVAVIYSPETPKKWSVTRRYEHVALAYFTPAGQPVSNTRLLSTGSFSPLSLNFSGHSLKNMVVKNGWLYLMNCPYHQLLMLNRKSNYYADYGQLFMANHLAVADVNKGQLWVVPRFSEMDWSLFYDRRCTTLPYEESEDVFGEAKPSEELLSTGFLKHSFFAVFPQRVDFYTGMKSPCAPKLCLTLPLPESVLCGFALGQRNNLIGFLTASGQVVVHKVRFGKSNA